MYLKKTFLFYIIRPKNIFSKPKSANKLLAWFLLFLCACQSHAPFNEESPYAALVCRYRNYHEAQGAFKRLKKENLNAYTVVTHSEKEGLWFNLLLGKAQSLESMMEKKIAYEDTHGFKELSIVNYNKLKKQMISLHPAHYEAHRTDAAPPDVGEQTHALIAKFPQTNYYRPVLMQLFRATEKNVGPSLALRKRIQTDLPRNISKNTLLKNSRLFAELVYEDDLSYKQITLQLILLKETHTYADSIAHRLTEKIGQNQKPAAKKITPLALEKAGLYGYALSIATRINRKKEYLILTDKAQKYLIFLQSQDNNRENMIKFAELIGTTGGLTTFSPFQNIFYTLPRTFFPTDHLAYFALKYQKHLGESSVSALREGQYEGNFVFNSTLYGNWEIKVQTSSDIDTAQRLFNLLYGSKKAGGLRKEPTQIFGRKAWVTYSRRKKQGVSRYVKLANEVQFATDKFLVVFSNKNRGWLTKEKLLARVRAGQFVVSFRKDT